MNQVSGRSLWYGGVGAVRDIAGLHDAGIEAVVFLASDLFDTPGREMIVCRIPLVDGEGNEPWRLRLALDSVGLLVKSGVPTLVCCSNGMSRSPAIVAATLAMVDGRPPSECLKGVTAGNATDVSAALWRDLLAAL